ncbi:MAG: ribonuclease HII [Bacillota bacterium]|nr:ribonuclease HII [Bacillota bacterium]
MKDNSQEIRRILELYKYEDEFYNIGITKIAGCDEAGRGPLAGPVVGAAVILPAHCIIEGLNDSKKLSEKKRRSLEQEIKEKALAWSLGEVDNEEIDAINILEAAKKAMLIAVMSLNIRPEALLIDGPFGLNQKDLPQKPIKKGDSLSASIAAASILAKEHRDRLMAEYHREYPQYGFEKHKGYPTKAHREAIKKYGISPLHRKTFKVK